jgi:hypothetical protein
VVNGSRPGWCETHAKAIDRLVDSRRDNIRTAMIALIDLDRAELLAEAEGAQNSRRGV